MKPDEKADAPLSGPERPEPATSLFPKPRRRVCAGDRPRISSCAHEIRVWTRDLLIAIGLALVIIVFLYQPVKVEGTSMAPLLSDQERIFINKFVYRFEPIERGDVVVFWYPLDRIEIVHQARDRPARRNGRDSPGRRVRQRQARCRSRTFRREYEDLSDTARCAFPRTNIS